MTIIAIPSKGKGGLNEVIERRFGKSENISFVSIVDNNIESVKIIPIIPTEAMGNLGMHVANIIENNNASITLVQYIGFKSFNSLKSKNIQIFQIPQTKLTLKECIDLYLQEKLEILTESNAHLIKD